MMNVVYIIRHLLYGTRFLQQQAYSTANLGLKLAYFTCS